jgi:hypothetical protein
MTDTLAGVSESFCGNRLTEATIGKSSKNRFSPSVLALAVPAASNAKEKAVNSGMLGIGIKSFLESAGRAAPPF